MGKASEKIRDYKKILTANVAGNVMEWYDFALYGYFATIISSLFFPADNHIASLLATFGVFAAGFLMRPIGGALFGYIGDKISRRRTLLLSVICMAASTTALGLLPTYAQVGIIAPILIVIVRLIQGLSVGGEFSGSVTYVAESAPLSKRGLFTSFSNVGGNIGMLLGVGFSTLITSTMPESMVMSWGWRLPFLFGALLGVGSYILRRQLNTSEVFKKHEQRHKNRSPFRKLFHQNRKQLVVGTLMAAGYGVFYYLAAVYLPTYLHTYFNIPLDTALGINTVGIALLLIAIPFYSLISDNYIKRKRFLMLSFGIMAVTAYPIFMLLESSSLGAISVAQIAFLLIVGIIEGCAPAFFAELFKTSDRLTGYSISFNLGMGIVGGATPMISTWLIKVTGLLSAPAFLLIVAVLVAGGALFFVRDHSREFLLREENS